MKFCNLFFFCRHLDHFQRDNFCHCNKVCIQCSKPFSFKVALCTRSKDRRIAQCVAISACASLAHAHLQRTFTSSEMDSIVLAGDELHVECRTSSFDENWLSVDDLPRTINSMGLRCTLEVEYIGGGNYQDKKRAYSLADLIKVDVALQSKRKVPHQHQGYIFVGQKRSAFGRYNVISLCYSTLIASQKTIMWK